MSEPAKQNWVVCCQYDGRDPFWAGHFEVDADLEEADAQFAAAKLAKKFLDSINHEWLSLPSILEIRRGRMPLILEDNDE